MTAKSIKSMESNGYLKQSCGGLKDIDTRLVDLSCHEVCEREVLADMKH